MTKHLRTVPSGPSLSIDAADLLTERMTQISALLAVLSATFNVDNTERPSDEVIRASIWGIEALQKQADAARQQVLSRG